MEGFQRTDFEVAVDGASQSGEHVLEIGRQAWALVVGRIDALCIRRAGDSVEMMRPNLPEPDGRGSVTSLQTPGNPVT